MTDVTALPASGSAPVHTRAFLLGPVAPPGLSTCGFGMAIPRPFVTRLPGQPAAVAAVGGTGRVPMTGAVDAHAPPGFGGASCRTECSACPGRRSRMPVLIWEP